MNSPIFWLAMLLMVADWFATGQQNVRLRRVTKPGALGALLVWFLLSGGAQGPLLLFSAGLFFSLLGDILLMLPARYFPLGGAAFFVTHLLYIAGFLTGGPAKVIGAIAALSSAPLSSAPLLMVRAGSGGHPIRTWRKALPRAAAGAYALVILLMTASAVSTLWQPYWKAGAAVQVAVGAALFLISDSTLAYNRFVRPSRLASVIVMVTYHLGQVLLAAGALSNFR